MCTSVLFLAAGDSGSATHICLAGEQCGAVLLPTKSGGQGPPPYSHGVGGYFGLYGTGQFDGQNSGHDFLGTVSCFSSFLRGMAVLRVHTKWIRRGAGKGSELFEFQFFRLPLVFSDALCVLLCSSSSFHLYVICRSTSPPPATQTTATVGAPTLTAITASSKACIAFRRNFFGEDPFQHCLSTCALLLLCMQTCKLQT